MLSSISKNIDMKYFIIFLIFSTGYFKLSAQTEISGEIIGFDGIDSVDFFLPVGSYYNYSFATKVSVNKQNRFFVDLPLAETSFLMLRVGGEPVYLFVEPGDKIELEVKNTGNKYTFLKIRGNNAEGMLWYNIYNYLPAQNFDKPKGLIESLSEQSPVAVLAQIDKFYKKEDRPIDSLSMVSLVDKHFVEFAKLSIRTFYNTLFVNKLSILEQNELYRHKAFELKRLIYKNYPIDKNLLKTGFGGLYLFSNYAKDQLRLNPDLAQNRLDVSFGPYDDYVILPEIYLEYILSSALITQKISVVKEFDFDRGYSFFKKKFPESKYIPIIDGLIAKEKTSIVNTRVRFDTTSYKTLQQVIQQYKGHYLLIDLWATWCIPCKQEFSYYKDLNDEFKKKDITLLFISIDLPTAKDLWKKTAEQLNLEGFNLIANKDLETDIQKVVYESDTFSIPRYIMVNKKGEIVDVNAPRPINKASLMKVIEEKF